MAQKADSRGQPLRGATPSSQAQDKFPINKLLEL